MLGLGLGLGLVLRLEGEEGLRSDGEQRRRGGDARVRAWEVASEELVERVLAVAVRDLARG